jgi:SAM-dependent methyltransferase
MDDIARFSEVGNRYGEQLARGLRLTGETAEYYASRRIARIAGLAKTNGVTVRAILDFGCGTGSSFPLLRAAFPGARVAGFEPAEGLRALAMRAAEASGAEVVGTDTLTAQSEFDLVYCNGVFHHIPPAERAHAIGGAARAMRTGGLACIWENSPFNPGTRFIMSRVEFDDDAVLLLPRELRALQRTAGFTHVTTEFHFIFPRAFKFARPLESPLRGLPLGGQYVVVGRRD